MNHENVTPALSLHFFFKSGYSLTFVTLHVNMYKAVFIFVFLLLLPTSSCNRGLDNRDVRYRSISLACWAHTKLGRDRGRRRSRWEEADNRQLCWAVQRRRVRLRAVSAAEVCLLLLLRRRGSPAAALPVTKWHARRGRSPFFPFILILFCHLLVLVSAKLMALSFNHFSFAKTKRRFDDLRVRLISWWTDPFKTRHEWRTSLFGL